MPCHAEGGLTYHALNRANARLTLFEHAGDYDAFIRVRAEAMARPFGIGSKATNRGRLIKRTLPYLPTPVSPFHGERPQSTPNEQSVPSLPDPGRIESGEPHHLGVSGMAHLGLEL